MMLTGNKLETTISISLSRLLVTHSSKLMHIQENDLADDRYHRVLRAVSARISSPHPTQLLVQVWDCSAVVTSNRIEHQQDPLPVRNTAASAPQVELECSSAGAVDDMRMALSQ